MIKKKITLYLIVFVVLREIYTAWYNLTNDVQTSFGEAVYYINVNQLSLAGRYTTYYIHIWKLSEICEFLFPCIFGCWLFSVLYIHLPWKSSLHCQLVNHYFIRNSSLTMGFTSYHHISSLIYLTLTCIFHLRFYELIVKINIVSRECGNCKFIYFYNFNN